MKKNTVCKNCRNCENGLKRSNFSFSRYGSYGHSIECCLIENEKTPYRRNDDTCEKFVMKGAK